MTELSLEIRGVVKKFAAVTAVDNVSLSIERGEFFSLLGPSGCGKTTLLRLIAGFEMPTAGEILIHGNDVAALPPYKRPVNTVFQHYSLFPHLNVFQNIAFGLQRKNVSKPEIDKRVAEALDLVQLSGFERRRPGQLSGGQKQRVALARALVLQPEVLLLDEPLGALDMKLRKEMQVELKNLQQRLKITFIFVTHDQEEALVMSDRIAVMNKGRVEQVGTSTTIFEHPRTNFVANFMGASNIFEGGLTVAEDGTKAIRMGDLAIPVDYDGSGRVEFVVRPEKILLLSEPRPERINLPVVVQDEIYQGTNTSWVVDYGGRTILVIEQNSRISEDKARFAPGDKAFVSWNAKHTVVLEPS